MGKGGIRENERIEGNSSDKDSEQIKLNKT